MNETEPCAACGESQRTFFRNLAGAYCCEDCAGMEVDSFKALAKPTAPEFRKGDRVRVLAVHGATDIKPGDEFFLERDPLAGPQLAGPGFLYISRPGDGEQGWCRIEHAAIEQPEGGEFKPVAGQMCEGQSTMDRRPICGTLAEIDERGCSARLLDGRGISRWVFLDTLRPISAPPSSSWPFGKQPAPESVKAAPPAFDRTRCNSPGCTCVYCRHRAHSPKLGANDPRYPKSDLDQRIAAVRAKIAVLGSDMDRGAERRAAVRKDRRVMVVGEFTGWVSTRHAR